MATFVERESAEWRAMWAQVETLFGDKACENDGEEWQYMGTYDGEHQFRHRDLPESAAMRAACTPGRTYYAFKPGTVGHIYH